MSNEKQKAKVSSVLKAAQGFVDSQKDKTPWNTPPLAMDLAHSVDDATGAALFYIRVVEVTAGSQPLATAMVKILPDGAVIDEVTQNRPFSIEHVERQQRALQLLTLCMRTVNNALYPPPTIEAVVSGAIKDFFHDTIAFPAGLIHVRTAMWDATTAVHIEHCVNNIRVMVLERNKGADGIDETGALIAQLVCSLETDKGVFLSVTGVKQAKQLRDSQNALRLLGALMVHVEAHTERQEKAARVNKA